MILELNGIYAGLRFSSAHIVFGHESCGVIHGHSYYVDVKLCGEPSGEFGFVCDFKIVKEIVKELCDEFDHKLLIPKYHPKVEYTFEESSMQMSYLCKSGKIKEYKFPLEDVNILPLKSTTAEEMSEYFAKFIKKKLEELNISKNIEWIETTVNEGIGQGATYRLDFR
ncbi:MAG: 6-pyruvoyltetrahydropterin/6-carboxytetrahydropterin synthase [Methanothermococcus sp.]|jgi:6-pyruvoyltetrahydropterin/6-carboxytetrahydropterin synthase|uniref:6-carboxytetrahydropterin synthase QueD n=1 Tax=Methanothermococcus TaxID=155862 RepID=UPI00037FDD7F|nr:MULTISPECIES: 6-carboxytetrahydropterin synthase QueD [Methanothermococcus]MDK2790726.1 6-pyruvoyltetrahydropterin/6-carboxytetrahydropterin synthase [Methanothermococcus sp.]MDK2987514.1 6-pyruvoyltetrahydropterin/6-carboxytetrahydropterin synthase [Methanothermococcus sp.]